MYLNSFAKDKLNFVLNSFSENLFKGNVVSASAEVATVLGFDPSILRHSGI
jgi:hypothetical protein